MTGIFGFRRNGSSQDPAFIRRCLGDAAAVPSRLYQCLRRVLKPSRAGKVESIVASCIILTQKERPVNLQQLVAKRGDVWDHYSLSLLLHRDVFRFMDTPDCINREERTAFLLAALHCRIDLMRVIWRAEQRHLACDTEPPEPELLQVILEELTQAFDFALASGNEQMQAFLWECLADVRQLMPATAAVEDRISPGDLTAMVWESKMEARLTQRRTCSGWGGDRTKMAEGRAPSLGSWMQPTDDGGGSEAAVPANVGGGGGGAATAADARDAGAKPCDMHPLGSRAILSLSSSTNTGSRLAEEEEEEEEEAQGRNRTGASSAVGREQGPAIMRTVSAPDNDVSLLGFQAAMRTDLRRMATEESMGAVSPTASLHAGCQQLLPTLPDSRPCCDSRIHRPFGLALVSDSAGSSRMLPPPPPPVKPGRGAAAASATVQHLATPFTGDASQGHGSETGSSLVNSPWCDSPGAASSASSGGRMPADDGRGSSVGCGTRCSLSSVASSSPKAALAGLQRGGSLAEALLSIPAPPAPPRSTDAGSQAGSAAPRNGPPLPTIRTASPPSPFFPLLPRELAIGLEQAMPAASSQDCSPVHARRTADDGCGAPVRPQGQVQQHVIDILHKMKRQLALLQGSHAGSVQEAGCALQQLLDEAFKALECPGAPSMAAREHAAAVLSPHASVLRPSERRVASAKAAEAAANRAA